ncbi:MAG: Non-reducing end alpha-L-arabinofuranosidase BoGH43A [Candidatus Ordinivivax streblomastigis]|uniref:Non-reducing end alpha-L-arabinofuranosidase BoGH43A n=1 Tax=Candidatus Ordinivivax streblomastigis TaxID=2540710 RepID=A0A5M8P3U2_9BACT|nr:MAG: Non-reducing end alpha-L-arabinofuranosidase BoGH43A [Candidatus Ordinivivax streblomastigis]
MRHLSFFLLFVLFLTRAQAQNERIVANPINLNYRFQFDEPSRREAADPVCEYFKGKYYLFASKSGGYWSSPDLAEWTYIPCTTISTQENYAPTILILDEKMYYFTGSSNRIFYTDNPNIDSWQELSPTRFEYSVTDPAFYKDEDTGKIYMYWGCSDKDPIMGVEIDPNNGFKSIGTSKKLIEHNGDKYGWEVPGKDNEENRTGWNEGPCMIKYKGKYYLQYAAPGTEYRIYGDGIYVGDTPLGPFTYMENSPFSFKPGGFIGGAGHGHTFKDKYGNYWHVASMRISKRHSFERRLGLFPVYFDENDVLYAHTVLTDYPFVIPSEKVDFKTTDCSKNWNLLSYKKPVSASSSYTPYVPDNANNEEVENGWSAQTGNAGEWWQIDLEKSMTVNAIQVNFADQDFTNKATNSYVYYQYKIEYSATGETWISLIDRTQNTLDRPHELIVLNTPQAARYLRITNTKNMDGKFSLYGFRVFGQGNGTLPGEVSGLQIKRKYKDHRRFLLNWNKQENATGYIVRWGIEANKLNNASMVFTNQLEAGYFNRDSEYYFAIDAFNESGFTYGTAVTKGEIFAGSPYKGITREIPGTIEAEDFNEGGKDFAYYDTTPNNTFSKYRTSEDVDINEDRRSGVIFIDNTSTGEYTNYTIQVPKSGFYDFDCIGASVQTGNEGGFYLTFDGDNSSGTALQKMPVGNKPDFHTVTLADLPLTEGSHVVTFNVQGSINVDKFIFKNGKAGLNNPKESSVNVYPNPSGGIFNVRLSQSGYSLVSDIFGRNIYAQYTHDTDQIIDLSDYPTGIYILSFSYGDQNNKIKLIKK